MEEQECSSCSPMHTPPTPQCPKACAISACMFLYATIMQAPGMNSHSPITAYPIPHMRSLFITGSLLITPSMFIPSRTCNHCSSHYHCSSHRSHAITPHQRITVHHTILVHPIAQKQGGT
eukprot:1162075-Pelagomonas_calceolata.AAC.9